MKNLILLILVGMIGAINAQGITMTLGGNTANDKFIVENSDSEAVLVVTGEGKVGINTTIPYQKLEVKSSDDTKDAAARFLNDNGTILDIGVSGSNGGSGAGNDNPYMYTNNKDLIILTGEGSVGLGITNPLSKLSIGGSGNSNWMVYSEAIGSSGIGVYGLASNSSGLDNYGGYFRADGIYGNGVYGHASNSGSVKNYGGYFRADGSTGRGVFGFAANNGNVANVGGYFEAQGEQGYGVYGYASNTGVVEVNYGGFFHAAGSNGVGVKGETPGTLGTGVYGFTSGDRGVGVFGASAGNNSIGVKGLGEGYNFYAAGSGTNYGGPSSIRWKRNIVEIDKPLEKIAEIRGVYFDWDEEHGGQRDVGCIGEEVGKVLPEIVVYEENGIDVDGMDYSKLTPLLIEVAKAQQKLIEELTKRIEALENK